MNQMTKTNQLYFLTYSDKGDGQPDGFYCEECFNSKIENQVGFIPVLTSIVDPEDTPYYSCHTCEKDYRD